MIRFKKLRLILSPYTDFNTTSVFFSVADYIRPICLASIDSPPLSSEFKLFVAGWGMTENSMFEETMYLG